MVWKKSPETALPLSMVLAGPSPMSVILSVDANAPMPEMVPPEREASVFSIGSENEQPPACVSVDRYSQSP